MFGGCSKVLHFMSCLFSLLKRRLECWKVIMQAPGKFVNIRNAYPIKEFGSIYCYSFSGTQKVNCHIFFGVRICEIEGYWLTDSLL